MRFLLALLLWYPLATQAQLQDECELDCLICSALGDPAEYAEGAMKAMQAITPGASNWLFRSDVDLTNNFGMPAHLEPQFARLMQTFDDYGMTVVFALQPTRGMMHRDKILPGRESGFAFPLARRNLARFQQQLRQGGALVPDILPIVDQPPAAEYFFRRDHHWTPSGAEITARIIADHVRQHPVYEELAKKAYRTEPGVMVPKDGTMNRALRKICGNNFGFQYVQGFQTVPAEADSDALFGDSADPEIVLVGTSNSAARDDDTKNYNFEGFLKQYLEADILNYSLPGAGQEGSVLHYLLSEDYRAGTAPKLLIWELPSNYMLEDELIYRQLIPAIRGGCSKSPRVILSGKLQLAALQQNQRIEVISNSGSQRQALANFDGFLDIRFSDRNIRDFYVITYYDNGERDKAWFRRTAIIDGGQYYLELSRDARFRNANLLSVFLEPTQDSPTATTVDVQLCQ